MAAAAYLGGPITGKLDSNPMAYGAEENVSLGVPDTRDAERLCQVSW